LQFLMDGTIRQEQVIAFLRHLSGQIIMVWASLGAHKGWALHQWLRRCKRIHLEYLLGYAAELNPNEYGWAYLKTNPLANYCPADIKQLYETVVVAAEGVANQQLPRICSGQALLGSFIHATGLSIRFRYRTLLLQESIAPQFIAGLSKKMKDFLCINDCSTEQLKELLQQSIALKKLYKSGGRDLCLSGKTLAMLFEKPSLRTRISFQVAMTDLGGNAIYVKPEDIGGIGKREAIKDIARVLSRYVDGIMARTFEHSAVTELAAYATVPVINALTDWSHPCQAMADVLTILEHFGWLEGIKIAFIGDGNNVARSLAFACGKLDMKIVVASPAGYELDNETIRIANKESADRVRQTNDPREAVVGADVIYTDTWVSMGQEGQKQKRIAAFAGFQVNSELVKSAPAGVKIMHCLPAYRGFEITDEVAESADSIIFDQAENRLHCQRALLKKLMM